MLKRIAVSKISLCVSTLLSFLLFVCSCKKSSPQGASEEPQQTTVENSHAAAQTSADGAGEMVLLDIELPKPHFEGTPQNIRVEKLEPGTGKRPPFYVPAGTTNVALGKSVTSSDPQPIIGYLYYVTDGDKEATEGSYVELAPFKQHITIDLGAEYEVYAIVVWHYHKEGRVYSDVVVQVSNDPDFITDVSMLFNNDHDNSSGLGAGQDMHYLEKNEGKLIDAKGTRARYVRLYSNGNTSDDMNHYIEVEVYGKPAR
jgi:hypothetical protein